MLTTMMDVPLSLNHLLERAGALFPTQEIVSRLPDKTLVRHSYAEWHQRTRALAAALAGLGVTQIATLTAMPLIARGELVQVLSDWTGPTIPLYVVYPPNRHLSAKVRAFVEWVAELFAQHPQLVR